MLLVRPLAALTALTLSSACTNTVRDWCDRATAEECNVIDGSVEECRSLTGTYLAERTDDPPPQFRGDDFRGDCERRLELCLEEETCSSFNDCNLDRTGPDLGDGLSNYDCHPFIEPIDDVE